MNDVWKPLGETAPAELVEARLQLHYAVQAVSSIGFTFVPAEPDWSHTALSWDSGLEALVSKSPPGSARFRAALIIPSFEIALLDDGGQVLSRATLQGRAVGDLYSWLTTEIGNLQGRSLERELFRPDHELPPYKAREGEPFPFEPVAAFSELARWYGDADMLLREIQASEAGASDVVVWPHHFDIATLITLPGEGETVRTVGVGLSPGDESYPEPYWYVSPWPAPEPDRWPELSGGGFWHTQGFTAAVLPSSRLSGATADPSRTFLRSAVAASRALLE